MNQNSFMVAQIVTKFKQIEVLMSEGKPMPQARKAVRMSDKSYYR